MITSGLIGQLRAKYGDQPKAAQVIRTGNGAATLFNVGRARIPVMENSYSVYKGTSAMIETTSASEISGIDTGTGIVTVSSMPDSWTTSLTYDLVRKAGGFAAVVRDVASALDAISRAVGGACE